MTTEQTMTPAEQELRDILDGVAEEMGGCLAREAARGLLAAVQEGRIDGTEFGDPEDDGSQGSDWQGCAVGQLAYALGTWRGETPDLPVWTDWHDTLGTLTPLEAHVTDVEPGQTPRTTLALADLQSWLTSYLSL